MRIENVIESTYAEAVKGIKEEWFQDASTQWYNYILGLHLRSQVAYLIVVMHNQIMNGGFHQYFVNGYGQFSKITVHALRKIGAPQKAALLEEAYKLVNSEKLDDNVFRQKLLNLQLDDLFIGDNLFVPLDKLDTGFFENETEDIEVLLNDYLHRNEY